jgi:hypothetical protein
MKDIVILPAWHRDDFLAATCHYIKKAKFADQHHYLFMLDRGHTQGVFAVANEFPLDKTVILQQRHSTAGNTFNVLEGYKQGIATGLKLEAELIYLIEEDIFVGEDFFDFHRRTQQQFDSFCVSAVRNQNDKDDLNGGPELVYCKNIYQSLGVSWKPRVLQTVLTHAKNDYYRNRKNYLLRNFPKSRFGSGWDEQDGLINRLVELKNHKCLFPFVPRAFHAGFTGYNRPGNNLPGTLANRVQKLLTMTDDEMNAYARSIKDIKREPLTDYGIETFQMAQSGELSSS